MDLAESAGLTLTPEEIDGAANPLLARIDGWKESPLPQLADPAKAGSATERAAKVMPPAGFKSWSQYLTSLIGPPPEGMHDPHAHHILFKEGNGATQRALVKQGQEILRRNGIDPLYGIENLVWAPNRVAGQHNALALKHVVDVLVAMENAGQGRSGLVAALKKLGLLAARRTK